MLGNVKSILSNSKLLRWRGYFLRQRNRLTRNRMKKGKCKNRWRWNSKSNSGLKQRRILRISKERRRN
jgi:hypothetical protein